MCSQMCCQDIFVNIQPFGCNLKGGLFEPQDEGLQLKRARRSGMAHSAARHWVSISSPLTHMVYLLPFMSFLTGWKSIFARRPRIRWQLPPKKLLLCRMAKMQGQTICQWGANRNPCTCCWMDLFSTRHVPLTRQTASREVPLSHFSQTVVDKLSTECIQEHNGWLWTDATNNNNLTSSSKSVTGDQAKYVRSTSSPFWWDEIVFV